MTTYHAVPTYATNVTLFGFINDQEQIKVCLMAVLHIYMEFDISGKRSHVCAPYQASGGCCVPLELTLIQTGVIFIWGKGRFHEKSCCSFGFCPNYLSLSRLKFLEPSLIISGILCGVEFYLAGTCNNCYQEIAAAMTREERSDASKASKHENRSNDSLLCSYYKM